MVDKTPLRPGEEAACCLVSLIEQVFCPPPPLRCAIGGLREDLVRFAAGLLP